MCGIAGVVYFDGREPDDALLHRMSQAIIHRGPDDEGLWHNGRVGFAHRRLSILDVSQNGHQPMHSPDGRYTIIFNGEIYNHKEFRNELTQRGFKFRSDSDTEVLLYLYMEYGEKMLHRLNGMFAFAIWDKQQQSLFACRDRMGVKPFYYYFDQQEFVFASEPKAIFEAGIEKRIDTNNINEWLLYRFVAGEETLLKNIKKILPGHFIRINGDGKATMTRWYHLGERIHAHPTIANPEQWFEETFLSSVAYRMVSDVPVGVLLSGGLDSSSVVAALKSNHFKAIQTFTIGFKNFEDDESSIASKFSAECGYISHVVYLENNTLNNRLHEAIYHLDEPLTHNNDPQLIEVSSYASRFVKVLLSGEGADELMGGYVRYKTLNFLRYKNEILLILSCIPKALKSPRILKLERYFRNGNTSELIASNASNFFSSDFENFGIHHIGISNPYRSNLMDEAKQYFPKDHQRQMLYYDQHTYLQSLNDRNDRSTMAASIECREPFQDYRLVEGLGTLSARKLLKGKKGKQILVDTIGKKLPDYITGFRKVGLSVPWYKHIHENETLQNLWDKFIISEKTKIPIIDYLPRKKLAESLASHPSAINSQLMLQLFMFNIWQETYFKN